MTPSEKSEVPGSPGTSAGQAPPWQRAGKDEAPATAEVTPVKSEGYLDQVSSPPHATGDLSYSEHDQNGLHVSASDYHPGTGDYPAVDAATRNLFGDNGDDIGEAKPQETGLPSAAARARPAPTALRPRGRGPRRASLQVKRFDPWSVLKLSLVLGVAMFFVWLVAVGVLYTVLDGMGVWDKLNGTYSSLVGGEGAAAPTDPLISAGRVFGIAAILGAINIVLVSALATVSAFIYNVSADLAGGLEVTLSEPWR